MQIKKHNFQFPSGSCSRNMDIWDNGKEVPRLDLTSSTMPGQKIHYGRPHPESKYNKSVWLAAVSPCRTPIGRLSPLLCLITRRLHVCYISQLLRDSFSIFQQPPIWKPPSHYSMVLVGYFSVIVKLQTSQRFVYSSTAHCVGIFRGEVLSGPLFSIEPGQT